MVGDLLVGSRLVEDLLVGNRMVEGHLVGILLVGDRPVGSHMVGDHLVGILVEILLGVDDHEGDDGDDVLPYLWYSILLVIS